MQARVLNHYIESNLDRQLSLEELAAVTRTSTSHFLRQFKARFGVPPHAYVLRMRLEHARNTHSAEHLLADQRASRHSRASPTSRI